MKRQQKVGSRLGLVLREVGAGGGLSTSELWSDSASIRAHFESRAALAEFLSANKGDQLILHDRNWYATGPQLWQPNAANIRNKRGFF